MKKKFGRNQIEVKDKEIIIDRDDNRGWGCASEKYSIVFKNKSFDIYRIHKEENKEIVRSCINYNRGYLDKFLASGFTYSRLGAKDQLDEVKELIFEKFEKEGFKISESAKNQEYITDVLSSIKYPFLETLAQRFKYPASELSSTFKTALKNANTWEEFLKNLTGSDNDQIKRFVGELIEYGQLFYLTLMYSIKDLVPVEYYKLIWDDNKNVFRNSYLNGRGTVFMFGYQLRVLLKNYKKERIRILLSTIKDPNEFKDTLFQYNKIKDSERLKLPEKPKSFKELHDAISRQFRILSVDYKKLEQSDLAKKVDGKIVNGMRIETAKDTHQLAEWGEIMGNCIASYGYRYNPHNFITLLGVYKKDELIYNLELDVSTRNYKTVQFKAKHNNSPDKTDSIIIEAFLDEIREQIKLSKMKLPGVPKELQKKNSRDKDTIVERPIYTTPAPNFGN